MTAIEFRRMREGLARQTGSAPGFHALGGEHHGRRHRLRRPLMIVVVVLLATAIASALLIRADRRPRLWVVVNGHKVGLQGQGRGQVTVAQALAAAGLTIRGAPLYSVHHRLLDPEGVPPEIKVDGRPAALVTELHRSDSVEAASSAEQTEPLVHRIVSAGTAVTGNGLPDVERTVWHSGLPAGDIDEVVGARSGEVVSRTAPPAVIPASADTGKVVELTFDDGPNPTWTPQVLDILDQEKVHATFSLVGYAVLRYGGLARQEAAMGEAICNHSAHHNEKLDSAPHDVVAMEIDLGADIIKNALGRDPICYRPPGNALSPDVIATAHERHFRVLSYSVDPSDYRAPPAPVLLKRILDNVRPGSVIVLHDGGGDRSQTVAMLRPLIDNLKAQGYRFTTMLDEPPTG